MTELLNGGRLPDFVIIGTMKSGTSALFSWLGSSPNVSLPTIKEPKFFSDETNWRKGLAWYASLFPDGSNITGEASVGYSDPSTSSVAASRLFNTLPKVDLICVLRDPIARLRSHYRHEVQRSREHRPMSEVLKEDDCRYVRRSLYYEAVEPYFPAGNRLLMLRMEHVLEPPYTAWPSALRHIGASQIPPPGERINVGSEKKRFRRPTLWLWKSGLLQRMSAVAPSSLRRLGKRLLLSSSSTYQSLIDSSYGDIPPAICRRLWESASRLEQESGVQLGFGSHG